MTDEALERCADRARAEARLARTGAAARLFGLRRDAERRGRDAELARTERAVAVSRSPVRTGGGFGPHDDQIQNPPGIHE
jgi:hypothetical protein